MKRRLPTTNDKSNRGEGPLRKNLVYCLLGVVILLVILLMSGTTVSVPNNERVHTVTDVGQSNVNEMVQKIVDEKLMDMMLEFKEDQRKAADLSSRFPVKKIFAKDRKRILVTGGAGFVGSHLVDVLMMQGHEVTVLDNLYTGRRKNIEHWINHPNFNFIVHDVVDPIQLQVDQIYHLACPASPPHYQHNPIKTIKTSVVGTTNMLELAARVGARILLTSTSEVYGDPIEHPQKETYNGNVNPIGPRACYDEGKRAAETLMYAFETQSKVEVRVARIFNTFGPRMHPNDGRVVSNFIIQSLQDEDLTIYGSGKQTRSFQYVSDLVNGLVKLMEGDYTQPVNLGNPDEYSIGDFAEKIIKLVKETEHDTKSSIIKLAGTKDDPNKRQPDISVAWNELHWKPVVDVETGLKDTIAYFKKELEEEGRTEPIKPQELRGN